MAGDFYKATQTLDEVRRYVVNEDLRDQLEVFATVLTLASIDEMDGEVEEFFLCKMCLAIFLIFHEKKSE